MEEKIMKNMSTSIKVAVLATFTGIVSLAAAVSENETPKRIPSVVLDKDSTATKPNFVPSPIVDFDAYLKLASAVKQMRETRLVSLDTFLEWGQQPSVVILDTRSDSLYNAKHIQGAIHLNFADFTQEALDALIPDKNTKILIYCNNNFKEIVIEPAFFTSKVARPIPVETKIAKAKLKPVSNEQMNSEAETANDEKPLTLALNIPTFINLVGYGYTNIYELGEQVYVFDSRLKFEGTAVWRESSQK